MNIDFIGRTKVWFAISGVFLIISIAALLIKGLAFGIEFKGGTIFDVKFTKQVDIAEVRQVLSQVKLAETIIQPVGKQEMLIRTTIASTDRQAQQVVTDLLDKEIGIKDRSIQSVGKAWGSYITQAAMVALVLSLVGLLIYIAVRFEFKMGVAAVLALVHDLIITVGIYSLVGREVTPNTIAALLTILGYSLYDTIVVFHRVSENTSRIMKQTYGDMVNQSINQVLVRSINTTLSTLIPVIVLLAIGGPTLKDFAFALFVGITSGAYSSIFVATPILSAWKETEPHYRSLRKKYGKIS